MDVNTPRDRLMTMDNKELRGLLTAGYLNYTEFSSILKCREWYRNDLAKELRSDIRYANKKLIIIGGVSRTGKSSAADAIFNKYK